MSACVETMFYSTDEYYSQRNVPWHGLGTPVVGSPTSRDAIIASGLNWKVESKPIYDSNNHIIPGYKANTRNTDMRVLGIVTDKYKIVQNDEAFDFTDSLVNEGMTYETAGALNNGKKIWLLGKMPSTKILSETIEPYICFVNTHDGTGAIKICMTPVRVVCNNTLNFALQNAKRMWSTKHMGNINAKLIEARNTLGLVNDYMDSLSSECDYLASKTLTKDDLLKVFDSIYTIDFSKDSARKIKNINDIKDSLVSCLNAPDVIPFQNTAYGAMMAITDYADHSIPFRDTKTYSENRWSKIITGHPFVDVMFDGIKRKVA